MLPLDIHFIWCGSAINKPIEDLLYRKIINLMSFFKGSGYQLIFNIWVDRQYKPHDFISRFSIPLDIHIQDIYSLFKEIETDEQINRHEADAKFLRHMFSDEAGLISTYKSGKMLHPCTLTFFSKPGMKGKFKPMPAIAADIVKALIGYRCPGLYVDTGLSVLSEETAQIDLEHIMSSDHKFKPDIYFASPNTLIISDGYCPKELPDYQIMFSTEHPKCQKIFKAVIEEYYKVGNKFLLYNPHGVSHDAPNQLFRTYYSHAHSWHEIPYSSHTLTIWQNALYENPELFQELFDGSPKTSITLKPKFRIPLERNRGSIAQLAYKNRRESCIPDYKTKPPNHFRHEHSASDLSL